MVPQLVLAASDDGLRDIRELMDSGAVDAVVLASVAVHDPRIALLVQHGIPFATFERTDPDLPQSWVEVDNRRGVRDLTARLIGRAHPACVPRLFRARQLGRRS